MRVDWQQELDGLSLLEIREILRGLPFIDSSFDERFLARRLVKTGRPPSGKDLTRGRKLLAGLIASGLAEPDADRSTGWFHLTDSGISLRAARATKRVKRTRAEKAIAELLERVQRINADPLFLHDIEWVAVFGSYIRDEPDLGDIDVAVKMKARWLVAAKIIGKGETDRERRTAEFEAKYPPPASFYEKGFWRSWPETYTRRYLKDRSSNGDR